MGHAEAKVADALAAKTLSMDAYWMPFTPNRDFKHDPKMIVRAEGVHLWNDRGGKLIDGSSGLFCVNAGYGRKEIADAMYAPVVSRFVTYGVDVGAVSRAYMEAITALPWAKASTIGRPNPS